MGEFPLLFSYKYMRLNYILFLLTTGLICFGQKQSVNIEVEYQQFYEVNVFEQLFSTSHATLYANNNTSIYKVFIGEDLRSQPYNKEAATASDPSVDKAFDGDYLKVDIKEKEILFYDIILKNHFLIKDIYNEFNWNILNETKTIQGYECIKASTKYRGREWIAWFTPQISLPFGPWKLHGLPGLILEANDAKNEITYKAVKIQFKANNILNENFTSLVKTKNKKPLSYKKFLEDRNEAFDNLFKKMESENSNIMYRDVEGEIPRTGPELKFEWED